MTAPMSRETILALPPSIDLRTLGRVLNRSEPTIRTAARSGELEQLGIKIVKIGAKYLVITASVWAFLGLDGGADGASTESQPHVAAGRHRHAASALRSVGEEGC